MAQALRVLRTGGLYFNGVDSYVKLDNVPIGPSFTALFWARSAGPRWNTLGFLASARTANGFAIVPITGQTEIRGVVYSSTGGYYGIGRYAPPDIQSWHLYGIMYDHRLKKGHMIFDGSVVMTTDMDIPRSEGKISICIGRDWPSDRYGNAVEDKFYLYNRVLANKEISDIYDKDAFIKDGLVVHLDFSEYEGNIAYDKSGMGNHATIYGGARWVIKKALRVLPSVR